jgi:hypothetical protein
MNYIKQWLKYDIYYLRILCREGCTCSHVAKEMLYTCIVSVYNYFTCPNFLSVVCSLHWCMCWRKSYHNNIRGVCYTALWGPTHFGVQRTLGSNALWGTTLKCVTYFGVRPLECVTHFWLQFRPKSAFNMYIRNL